MKISWGVGITISIIVFTIISLWFVYFAFNQDVNLVRDDYYEAEVQYDEKMDIVKRTNKLNEQPEVKISDDYFTLTFPKMFENNKISGSLLFYRPSHREHDKSYKIEIDTNNTQHINRSNFISGLWKVQINWKVDSLNYFNEQILMVP